VSLSPFLRTTECEAEWCPVRIRPEKWRKEKQTRSSSRGDPLLSVTAGQTSLGTVTALVLLHWLSDCSLTTFHFASKVALLPPCTDPLPLADEVSLGGGWACDSQSCFSLLSCRLDWQLFVRMFSVRLRKPQLSCDVHAAPWVQIRASSFD
jgi:hypothetical protein